MFKRMPQSEAPNVSITIEGRNIRVPESDTVAAAMLVAGIGYTRTSPISAVRRAPYCMMGWRRWLSLAMIGWSVVYFRFLI